LSVDFAKNSMLNPHSDNRMVRGRGPRTAPESLGRGSVMWSASAGILAATVLVTIAFTLRANGIG
jgi:hypothetical protein